MRDGRTLREAVRDFGDTAMKLTSDLDVGELWSDEYRGFADRSESRRDEITREYRADLSRRGMDRALWIKMVTNPPGLADPELEEDLRRFAAADPQERIQAFVERLEETAMHKDIVSRLWHAELSRHAAVGHDLAGVARAYRDHLSAKDAAHPALRYLAYRQRFQELDVMVAGFVNAALQTTTKGGMQTLWNAEYAALRSRRTINTARGYVSTYRAAIEDEWRRLEEVGTPHPLAVTDVLTIVSPPRRDMNLVNDAYLREVRDRHKGGQVAVERWREALARCEASVRDEETPPPGMLVALCLLTGRRPVEVGVMGSVELLPKGDPDRDRYVVFEGQAKTKGAGMAGQAYVIPVLTDASVVVRRWNELREHGPYGHLDNRAFTQAARPMTTYRRRLIDPLMPVAFDFQNRHLRNLYAEIAWKDWGKVPEGGRWSKTGYFARILGHSPDDLATSLSYQVFELSQDGASR